MYYGKRLNIFENATRVVYLLLYSKISIHWRTITLYIQGLNNWTSTYIVTAEKIPVCNVGRKFMKYEVES